jgi:hypothetical protein
MPTTRRLVRLFGLALVVFFVGAQFVPVDRSNPPTDPQQEFTARLSPPPAVASVIERSCRDCHSNRTTWPWYSRIAPVSWLVVNDVKEGRAHLNFSEWGTLGARRSARRLEEICEEIRSGAMPIPAYTLMHPSTKLAPQEIEAICGWTKEALAAGGKNPAR